MFALFTLIYQRLLTGSGMRALYSKSLHIRTYFFESQAEIGSYFKDTMTNMRVDMFLFEE